MDSERALVSKAVYTGNVGQIMREGILPEHFEDQALREVWEYLTDSVKKYKVAPGLTVLQQKFQKVDFPVVSESLSFVIDEFKSNVRRRVATRAVKDLADGLRDARNWQSVDSLFAHETRQLQNLFPTARVSRFREMDERIDSYRAQVQAGSPMGIRMGIGPIDNETMGIHGHELVTISGWSGTGKSTLAQFIGLNAWKQGKTVLLLSLEMDKDAIQRRFDTMVTHFPYSNLKGLRLTDDEIEGWEQMAGKVEKAPADIIVIDDLGRCTVDQIHAEIVRHQPDLAIVDYLTLVTPSGGRNMQNWEAVTALSREMKQMARSLQVPIIAVAQTNRASAQGGAELDNISYSVSIVQDSDIVIGLHRDDEMKENNQMEVRLIKNRDGRVTKTSLKWDLERMDIQEWLIPNKPKAQTDDD